MAPSLAVSLIQADVLPNFPPEICSLVEGYLDQSDLLSLRQMNRRLRHYLQEKWLEAFFRKWTHVFSYHGLSTLLQIVARPEMAKRLKSIEFRVLDFPEPGKDPRRDTEAETARMAMNAAWEMQELRLRRGGCGARKLKKIFTALVRHGVVIPVTIDDDCLEANERILRTAFGRKVLTTMGGDPERYLLWREHDRGSCDEVGCAVMTAIAATQYPVENLRFPCRLSNVGIGRLTLGLESSISKACSTALSNLSSLDLTLDPHMFFDERNDWTGNVFHLRSLPALQHLRLSLAHPACADASPRGLTRMMNCFPMKQIRTLVLGNTYGEPKDYISMLAKAKHSLRKLRLVAFDVLFGGCWSTIFRWLGQNLELADLWLEDVGHPMLGLYVCRGAAEANAHECNHFIGAAVVRDGLRSLVDRPGYAFPSKPEA
ncbi:hypothetical protein LTR78_000237 [Recurvomyces mirabilis]|uniref:F-box domain-containing protein n=1 Tax=Recurvomyces mirabilis TaxID=574656 RepID=A0AAE0WXR8_9PEZI|nr:hypothetical protein LTR78_000237 [Recurvomyces mirabilis]KAK5161893.1 hypothetical protein LTS14_000238 [Recurvomyces mirabilis]